MLCIKSISPDPYFNLATEEYLLKETGEEFFLTCINEPSVIVGKHQNTYAEINFDFVRKNNIKVARRITGGGTVYHDPGNLNFSFIVNGKEGRLVDFKKHTRPIIGFLRGLSVKAEFAGKNDLLVNGLKISGNAEHVFRNRVLHHGTLLFDSHLPNLSEALKVNPLKYRDKAVRSVRSRVSNISGILADKMDTGQLRDRLTEFIMKEKDGKEYILTEMDMEQIAILRDKKFVTWEWNYGYNPGYTLRRKICNEGKQAEFLMDVTKGVIENLSVEGNLFDETCKKEFIKTIAGCQHRYEILLDVVQNLSYKGCFLEITPEDLVNELF